jgi:hypothetical protein
MIELNLNKRIGIPMKVEIPFLFLWVSGGAFLHHNSLNDKSLRANLVRSKRDSDIMFEKIYNDY